MKSDLTAVKRDEYGTHIIKAKIINETELYVQFFNKTKNVLTPVFKIPANFGILPYIKPNEVQKEIEENLKLTKNIRRKNLLCYYNSFQLTFLVNRYIE